MSRAARVIPLLLVALVACTLFRGPEGVGTISADELDARIAAGDAPVVLDVRSEPEFAAGHIPGAILIPHDQLEGRLAELGAERDAEIVVHCQSGGRAAMAERTLTEAGFSNVVDLEGHMKGWVAGGHPVE